MVVAFAASIHEKEKRFEPIENGFRMTRTSRRPTARLKLLGVYGEPITTTIDFVLPNRRYEIIRCGEMVCQLTTVTPTQKTIAASTSARPGTFS